jgi:2-keto-4-pentenoate hydratase/2-oxohepta-3-ene-1,7-dioic acid hydratase in catechol pathway
MRFGHLSGPEGPELFVEAEGARRRVSGLLDGSPQLLAGIPRTLDALIRDSRDWRAAIAAALEEGPEPRGATETELLAPLLAPGSIVAIGLNYLDHCREFGTEPPAEPMVFAKLASSVRGPGQTVEWSAAVTAAVDWEAELGVVIGRAAKDVAVDDALDFVFGYTVVNDVTARDVQSAEAQWVRAKSLDTFCPLGPVVVTADELPDPQALAVRSRVNGETMQDSSTAEMIFGVAELVSALSRSFTLRPGDVIATGTPLGVGAFREPPRFLADGDVVEVEVEGIGTLENACRVRAADREEERA